jgi:hypothetical protein
MGKKKEITYPVVTQGKKGQPITVKNILFGSNILLKVTASYEDWNKFLDHLQKRKDHFPWDFYGSFAGPALENSKEEISRPEIGPYGTRFDYQKKKNNQSFVDDMQILAALLYKYRKSFPRKQKRGKFIDSIAQDLQRLFSHMIKGYRLKPFYSIDGPKQENFYLKYIYPGLRTLKLNMPEPADRVHNLVLLLNYVELYSDIRKDDQILFDLLRRLAFDFLAGCHVSPKPKTE